MVETEQNTKTENELEELLKLDIKSLVSEFTRTREEFKKYLKDCGVDIPDVNLGLSGINKKEETSAEEESILLDEFTEQSIKGISKSVKTVYALAEDFIKLFDLLPNNPALESLSLTTDDNKQCTAKELYEMIRKGQTSSGTQIIIDGEGLRLLSNEFGKSGGEEENKEQQEEEWGSEGGSSNQTSDNQSLSELSPFISQEEYDKLFKDEALPEISTESVSENTDSKKGNAPEAIQPKDVQLKVTPLTSDETSADSKETSEEANTENLSQEEPDKLFAGSESERKSSMPSQSDQSPSSPQGDVLSQQELDKLFGGSETSKSSEDSSETASNNEKGDTLSQEELDKLFGGEV